MKEKREAILAGRNPVREALRANQPLNKILLAGESRSSALREIYALAREKGIPVQVVAPENIVRLSAKAGVKNPQGVLAFVSPQKYQTLTEVLERTREEKGQPPLLVLLDHVEDPQNLGGILRVAEAVGAQGVIIPSRRSASLTPAAAKASAGASAHLPLARVPNLGQAIHVLKANHFWVGGATSKADKLYFEVDFNFPFALVVGSEGRGLSQAVEEKCDFLIRIPMRGKVTSLNVTAATAVILYEILRQRMKKFD